MPMPFRPGRNTGMVVWRDVSHHAHTVPSGTEHWHSGRRVVNCTMPMPVRPGRNTGMVVWRVRCVAPCPHRSVRDGTLAQWSQSGELHHAHASPSGTEYWDGGLERCVAPCPHCSVRDGTLAQWSQSGELDHAHAIPSGTEYWH